MEDAGSRGRFKTQVFSFVFFFFFQLEDTTAFLDAVEDLVEWQLTMQERGYCCWSSALE